MPLLRTPSCSCAWGRIQYPLFSTHCTLHHSIFDPHSPLILPDSSSNQPFWTAAIEAVNVCSKHSLSECTWSLLWSANGAEISLNISPGHTRGGGGGWLNMLGGGGVGGPPQTDRPSGWFFGRSRRQLKSIGSHIPQDANTKPPALTKKVHCRLLHMWVNNKAVSLWGFFWPQRGLFINAHIKQLNCTFFVGAPKLKLRLRGYGTLCSQRRKEREGGRESKLIYVAICSRGKL